MGLDEIDVPVEIVVARPNSHPAQILPIAAYGNTAQQSLLAKGAVVIVHQQHARRRIASHKDVRPSVFVDIAGDRGQPIRATHRCNSRFFRYVGKCTVAIVAIEIMLRSRQPSWTAIDGNTLE